MKYLFVGECRSKKAETMGVTWLDARLAAKPLFEALNHIGINPLKQSFINLFLEDGKSPIIDDNALKHVKASNLTIVAMGKKVQNVLTRENLKFLGIVHPAARGLIRKRERYIKHVSEILG